MKIQPAQPDALFWLASRTGLSTTGDFKGIEARDDAGRVHGVVGYDKWTYNSVRIHIIMSHPIKEFVQAAFHYPFVQAGLGVVIGETPESRTRARRLASRFGFREICRIRDGFAVGEDTIITELRREDWLARQRKG